MSYYFCIIGTKDNPLFEYEFGTSKQGGDGIARFPAEARHINQFIVHSSLDIVEEVQWLNNQMYLKVIDKFSISHISCFLTPTSVKFLLLHLPHPPNTPPPAASTTFPFTSSFAPSATTSTSSLSRASLSSSSSSTSTSIATNPTSPQTEEAIRQFFTEVWEVWVKTTMNPFYHVDDPVKSPVFRTRVAAAGRKYL
ncbi:TRAPP subunit [Hypocenomyce scalaris]|nr:TRAPP subunit [Hypocenomyce scalaris]